MIQLKCKDNVIEYTSDGYFQCGDYVNCPKKENQKCLGFDCFTYIDNVPGKLLDMDAIQKKDAQTEGVLCKTKESGDIGIKESTHSPIEQIRTHVARRGAIEN